MPGGILCFSSRMSPSAFLPKNSLQRGPWLVTCQPQPGLLTFFQPWDMSEHCSVPELFTQKQRHSRPSRPAQSLRLTTGSPHLPAQQSSCCLSPLPPAPEWVHMLPLHSQGTTNSRVTCVLGLANWNFQERFLMRKSSLVFQASRCLSFLPHPWESS